MGIPAVKKQHTTAGKWTQTAKKWVTLLGAGMTVMLFCAFTSVEAQAQTTASDPLARTMRTVTVTEKVPFETTYIDLPARYVGYSELVSEGVMGAKQIEAQVVFEGERAVKVLSIKSTDTGQPVNQVIRRGTKVVRSETVDGSRWKKSFVNPLKNGWLSADFYDYPGHNGIDIAAPYGSAVYAAAGGKVVLAGWYGPYGRCVIIEHADGSQTLYGHNSALQVSSGQAVKQGQRIASVGSTGNSTGNHLHFEIRVGESFLNPLIYMDQ